jgi:benzoylformate decarboxylase
LAGHDLAFIIGMSFLRPYIHHEPPSPLPNGLRLFQLDSNPAEIGKNYAVEIGLTGSLPVTLAALSAIIAAEQSADQRCAALERSQRISERRRREQAGLHAAIEASGDVRPMPARNLCAAIAKVLPGNAVVVEEAPSTHQNLMARLGAIGTAAGYFGHRGWALGWGAGAAVGVKLAWPERPVVALLGDGAALYGIQALWTASHLRLPVVYVIANNAQYKILKDVGAVMGLPQFKAGRHLGLDINEPPVDFVKLAEGFGVDAHRAGDPDEVSQLVEEGLRADAPLLLDVSIGH